jgi:hypothetical protein
VGNVLLRATVGLGLITVGLALGAWLRPRLLLVATRALLCCLLVIWAAGVATGILAQWQQGPGPEAVRIETRWHVPHRTLAHISIGATIWSGLASVVLSLERGVRTRRWLSLLGVVAVCTVAFLVLATSFTGYLGDAARSGPSYFRFRVLHTLLVPFVTGAAIAAWAYATLRLRIPAHIDPRTVENG